MLENINSPKDIKGLSITDSQGRTVDFKNTILIMTSNIGSTYLLEGIDENGDIQPESEKMVLNELRAHFRPEFLNRLDETIMFKPLTKRDVGQIIDLLIRDVNKRLVNFTNINPSCKYFDHNHNYMDPILCKYITNSTLFQV